MLGWSYCGDKLGFSIAREDECLLLTSKLSLVSATGIIANTMSLPVIQSKAFEEFVYENSQESVPKLEQANVR